MKQPYEDIIKPVEPRLNALGFYRSHDSESGTKFESGEFCMEFFVEARENNLSKSIRHKPERPNSTLDAFASMPAIDPTSYDLMIESHKKNSVEGEKEAIDIFISFLEEHAEIIFTFPFPEPFRTRFIDKVNEVMSRNFGRSTAPEEFNI